jgi:hypothetical protein
MVSSIPKMFDHRPNKNCKKEAQYEELLAPRQPEHSISIPAAVPAARSKNLEGMLLASCFLLLASCFLLLASCFYPCGSRVTVA